MISQFVKDVIMKTGKATDDQLRQAEERHHLTNILGNSSKAVVRFTLGLGLVFIYLSRNICEVNGLVCRPLQNRIRTWQG